LNSRRQWLVRTGVLSIGGTLTSAWSAPALAQAAQRVAIAVPGPGNLLFLPITLASKLGMDKAEGIELDIRYLSGGPQAYRELSERNTDFGAGGLAALALQRLNGKPLVSIVPTTRVPAYTLLVRSALKGQIKTIADLAGKVVGVKGFVPGGRSTSQLFTEYVLLSQGIQPDMVNYVSVGQSYDTQRAALVSNAVDAVMGDEPFATRLVQESVAFVLADYHDPETTRKQMGGLFLNGNIATRDDVVANRPELVEKMVKTLVRTLVWINKHSAEEMVEALALDDLLDSKWLVEVLKARKNIYSVDGRISASQVASVTRFLRATEMTPAAQAFDVRAIVNNRWAGAAP
jgi:NitT/TauT family transport system substrate-binding protein